MSDIAVSPGGARRFYLENQSGERKSLNAESGIFYHSPTGLGYSLSPTYSDLYYGFFQNVWNKNEPQQSIAGEVIFYLDPYTDYFNFVNWVASATQLHLIYNPFEDATDEYYRDVELSYMTKTEKTIDGVLIIPIEFKCLSPWYKPNAIDINMTQIPKNVARFDVDGKGFDRGVFAESVRTGLTGSVPNPGQIDAGIHFEYTGLLQNPVISLINASGILGQCVISNTIAAYETLVWDTREGHQAVYKKNGQVVTNLIDSVDLSYDPFPKVPNSGNTILKITANNGDLSGSVLATVYSYYRTV